MKLKTWILFCFFILFVGCRISGQVTYEGVGLEGVAVTLSGETPQTVLTDSEGRYAFEGIGKGSYTVTPSSVGFVFDQTESTVIITKGDVDSVDFTAEKRAVETGRISDMCSAATPGIVYALDQDNGALLLINTTVEHVVGKMALNNPEPLAMGFSSAENRIFIVSRVGGAISVFDLNTLELSEIQGVPGLENRDVTLSESLGRVYVLSQRDHETLISIFDMVTGQKVSDTMSSSHSSISNLVFDENSQKLFACNSGFSPSSIFRYSVQNDLIELEQSLRSGGNGQSINISPDGKTLVFPCGGGNGSGYTIYDYDTSNFSNVHGEWDVGTYPVSAMFSPDGHVLYATNGDSYDNHLYIMDAGDYSEIRKLPFPHADDYSVITPNADGSKVVGFSYDDYKEEGHGLYFFTDVKADPTPVPHGLGRISDMVAGSAAETVYALDQTHQCLYEINTDEEGIAKETLLPFTQPLAVSFSEIDRKVYIVSKFSGSVAVLDMESSEVTEMPFTYCDDGVDISLDPVRRRLFVLAKSENGMKLYMMDMETGEVLSETPLDDRWISTISYDANSQNIFASQSGISPSSIFRYSTSDDLLTLEQRLRTGGNGKKIDISPDGTRLVFPCGGGNGNGYTIYDYDTSDFHNVRGEWDIGTHPKFARFSPDGSVLFGVNGSPSDNCLYVMDVATYSEIRRLSFPNSGDYSVITPTSDGSKVVGFSYDDYKDQEHQFYFFSDVKPDPSPAPHGLGVISDMVSSGAPDRVLALDKTHQELYVINPQQERIENAIELFYTQPVGMAFSDVDSKVYVVSKFSGSVTVVDMISYQITDFPFAYSEDGVDIALSPLQRKIYVLGKRKYERFIYIMDMDSGEVLSRTKLADWDISSIQFDDNRNKLFASNSGVSPSSIFRYGIVGNSITLEQSLRSGANGRKISISPDGSTLVFPCGGGNGPGYTIYDYDTSDFNHVRGEWDVGTYPKSAIFSPDGSLLYATNGSSRDNYLYIMRVSGYSSIRKLPFPNADDYSVTAVNSDGSIVVGFSYDTNREDNKSLYFFRDVR